MNTYNINRRQLLSLGAAALAAPLATQVAAHDAHGELAAKAPIPGTSIYQLHAQLTDQDGHAFDLESLRGKLVLASMFYTSCEMVCPLIFESIHATIAALPAADLANVRVLMASFDPARDSVEVLKRTAQQRNCDARWTLVRTDDATTRKLAAVLGVQYRRLSNGEFNHSSFVTLLDREGRITGRTGKLGASDPAFVKAIHQASAVA